jgi:hypothetical protein
MSSYCRQKGRVKFGPLVTAKAAPASCAITTVSVRAAESPKLVTVYEHPAARYKYDEYDKKPSTTAQTVSSGSSTYKMVWEEPTSTSDDDVTLFEEPAVAEEVDPDDSILAHVSRTSSPMGKVKTKLTAWSWAKEQGQNDGAESKFLPLIDIDDKNARRSHSSAGEDPPGPPNTAQSSTRGSGPSSARHSGPQTPFYDENAEDEDNAEEEATTVADNEEQEKDDDFEDPVEIKLKRTMSRGRSATMPTIPTTGTDYITIPLFRDRMAESRRLSNLPGEEEHFKGHRDSVDIYRRHFREEEEEMNKQLMTTRDSFLMTKSKFDTKHPKAMVELLPIRSYPSAQWNRCGGLSPIPDSSPPNSKKQKGAEAMLRFAEKGEDEAGKRKLQEHPLDHVGCPVCEVEWAKWFEAKRRKAEVEGEADCLA